jgi:aryl-alcohol dehydrogenase-like predicted oxidoreductase
MQYRKIGNSDLSLSVITFGSWAAGGWMWGGTESNDAVKAIQAAYDAGVTSIDTAPAYGQGLSEEIVGEAVKNIGRDKVQVITKFGLRWDSTEGKFYFSSKSNEGQDVNMYRNASRESIIKECEDSLRRLQTDYIDLYQIHWPVDETPIQETMETVDLLIRQGKVRYAGVCNYSAEQVKEADKYVNIISDQVPYSMLRRKIEEELVPFTIKNNKAILAYSPLQLGVLTGKMKPGHKFNDGDHRSNLYYFTDENINKINAFLEKIRSIAETKNAALGQLVLAWTIEQPGITIALVGARNPKQALENAAAADIKLSVEEINFITCELNKLELVK